MLAVVLRKLDIVRVVLRGVRSGVDTWWEFFLFCVDHVMRTVLGRNPGFYHKEKVRGFKRSEYYQIGDIRLPLLDPETEDTFFWQGPFGQTCFHYRYFEDRCDDDAIDLSHASSLFWRETPYGYADDVVNVRILPGDIVIDAGSWIGDFAAYASVKGADRVYAFEPSPPAFDYLLRTAELNPNIYPFQEGLGDAISEIELFVDPENTQCNSFLNEDKVCRTAVRVSVTTVDAFVKKCELSRVDFIKASVQGYDMHLLRGGRETLRRFAPKLSFLYCSAHSVPYSMDDMERLIREINPEYKVTRRGKRLFAAVPKMMITP